MKLLLTLFFYIVILSVQAQTTRLDSLTARLSIDSISRIKNADHRIDSLQSSFNIQSDSLKQHYKTKLEDLDVAGVSVQHKMDSIASLQLPTGKYSHQLDSINALRTTSLNALDGKIKSLKSKSTDKLNALDVPPELKDKLSSVTTSIDGYQLPAKDLNMPSLNVEGSSLNGVGLGNNTQLPVQDIGKIEGLEGVQGSVGEISNVTKDAGAYQQDIQKLRKGQLDEMQKVPETLENRAGDLSGISEIKTQSTEALAPMQQMSEQAKNPEAMKEEALNKAQEIAVDHFAGKEEVLQQAMGKISKYKRKYPSINNLSEIKDMRKNQMHGKPFRERLVPGISFQVQKTNRDVFIHFNPYAGYRLTGHITAGAGWNQRFVFDNLKNKEAMIYGPRFFGEYRLAKGISPRLEIESMNTNVPPSLSGHTDPSSRQWVWSYMAGVKKEYRFFKSIKGNVMIMFNLYDRHRKSPYRDAIITRFGFEFPLNKTKSKPIKNE